MSISGVRKNFAYLFFILNIVVYFFCLMWIVWAAEISPFLYFQRVYIIYSIYTI